MPKLTLHKFHITGKKSKRTTSSGLIEMHVHYDTKTETFYFDGVDMHKYGLADKNYGGIMDCFKHCRSQRQAVEVVETLLQEDLQETRMLRIEIGVPYRIKNVPNPDYEEGSSSFHNEKTILNPAFPEHLKGMLNRATIYDQDGKTSGIQISFVRIMKIKAGDMPPMYAGCNKQWKYKKNDYSSYDANLILWTPEIEAFLINVQKQMDAMCENVIRFFSTDSVEQLTEKITLVQHNNQFRLNGSSTAKES
jgi:hypothetical protein